MSGRQILGIAGAIILLLVLPWAIFQLIEPLDNSQIMGRAPRGRVD